MTCLFASVLLGFSSEVYPVLEEKVACAAISLHLCILSYIQG